MCFLIKFPTANAPKLSLKEDILQKMYFKPHQYVVFFSKMAWSCISLHTYSFDLMFHLVL